MFRHPRHLTTDSSPCSRVLKAKQDVKPTTVRRQAEIIEHRNVLSKNLLELQQSQRIYMPGLGPLLEDEHLNDPAKLWLPSELSDEEQARWCLPGVPALEFRFRYAQADDSLAEIRRLRRMLQGLHDQNFKHPNLAQKSITRTKGLFASFQTKIRRFVARYRHSYQAMLTLDPSQQLSPGWMQRFQKLEDTDVRGPGRDSDDCSEGKFQPSWIWLVPRLTGNAPNGPAPTTNPPSSTGGATSDPAAATIDSEVAESMRVHWAKCQARADRYEEEVTLIVEEMGRTLRYFEWRKSWWLSLQDTREQSLSPPPIEICRGLRAYSARQGYVYKTLITSFVNRWRKLLVSHKLGTDWLCRYPATTDPPSPPPVPPTQADRPPPSIPPPSLPQVSSTQVDRSHPSIPLPSPLPAPSPQADLLPPPSIPPPPVSPYDDVGVDSPMDSDVESDDDEDRNYTLEGDEESDFDD